jgi:hypothetical protein
MLVAVTQSAMESVPTSGGNLGRSNNVLIPLCEVILEYLGVTQLAQFPAFVDFEGAAPCSQKTDVIAFKFDDNGLAD